MQFTRLTIFALCLLGSLTSLEALAQNRSFSVSKDRLLASPIVAPGIKASALWDGRKALGFHAANFPKMIPAKQATFLGDDEYVLGITVNGESRAYPTRFAAWHHVINDKVGTPSGGGKKFVTVTFCVVCNTGIRFDPDVYHQPLTFDFYGLYNGVMTMFDNQTKSLWLQVSGRAVKGPLMGLSLKTGPVLDTTWKRWKQLHPDTLVMAPEASNRENYDPDGMLIRRGFSHFPDSTFKKTLTRRDIRLPAFDMVLGVAHTPEPEFTHIPKQPIVRAYPLKTLLAKGGVINESIGAQRLAIFCEPESETAVALNPVLDGNLLTFRASKMPNGTLCFFDKETGSRWSIEGLCLEGQLKDKSLDRINCTMSEWYGWAAYFPHTTIYGMEPSSRIANNHTGEAGRIHRTASAEYKQPQNRTLLANKR